MRHLPCVFALLVLPVMLALAGLGGCASLAPPDGEPSIRGVVTSITLQADGLGTILVEEMSPQGLEYDKASITINKATKLLKHVGDDYVRSTSADLRSGMEVEVWITGPVGESYPIQADADTVVALE